MNLYTTLKDEVSIPGKRPLPCCCTSGQYLSLRDVEEFSRTPKAQENRWPSTAHEARRPGSGRQDPKP